MIIVPMTSRFAALSAITPLMNAYGASTHPHLATDEPADAELCIEVPHFIVSKILLEQWASDVKAWCSGFCAGLHVQT